jgi:uncharacterized Zn finger protein
MDCSCPDWADLCKHLAASLYGVGARLDQNPGLLFLLRGVDPTDLISKASAAEAVRQTTTTTGAPAMSESEAADVFGIELEPRSTKSTPAPVVDAPVSPLPTTPPPTQKPATARARGQAVPRKQPVHRRMTATMRARIVAAAKARWAKINKQRQDLKRVPQSKKRGGAKARPGA